MCALCFSPTSAIAQVMCSEDGNYQGDMQNRRTDTCTFADFLDNISQPAQQQGVQLYLAQSPISSSKDSDAPLSALLSDISLPQSLSESGRLTAVNLWMASR